MLRKALFLLPLLFIVAGNIFAKESSIEIVNGKVKRRGVVKVVLHKDNTDKNNNARVACFNGVISFSKRLANDANVDTISIWMGTESGVIEYLNRIHKSYIIPVEVGDIITIKPNDGVPVVEAITSVTHKENDLNWLQIFDKEYKNEWKPFWHFQYQVKGDRKKRKYAENYIDVENKKLQFIEKLYSQGKLSDRAYSVAKQKVVLDRDIFRSNTLVKKYVNSDIKEESLLNDEYLTYGSYRKFLYDYTYHNSGVLDVKPKIIDVRKCFDWVVDNKTVPELSRAYLMYSFLKVVSLKYSADDFVSRLNVIKSNLPDQRYNEFVWALKPGTTKGPIIETSSELWLQDNRGNKITFKELLEKHKGKVLYVDFWATWCAPCRAGIPVSHELSEEMNGEDVVFVYLCVYDKLDRWKKESHKLNLNRKDDSYFVLNERAAKMIEEYEINSIPRYMFIGKDGKIMDDDAPRPGNIFIKRKIRKLLK
ncbi:MAG: TlpA family protein disulfide reductase [Bacteroidales bacterium]|jgi:thiol-disulfide isomerase/thioredoxin|nr:TlpA family protein disulfide reductase [Bacteroidales bacterium]